MSDFLCTLTNQINSLTELVNRIQTTGGLLTDTKLDGTILGRLNSLETEISGSTGTSEATVSRMKVERNVLIYDNGKFDLEYTPIDGQIVNGQALIDNGDGTEDIWNNVLFSGKTGVLVGAGTSLDGLSLTVTYLYAESITKYEYTFVDAVNEFVHNLNQHLGTSYAVEVKIQPNSPTVELRWVNVLDNTDFTTETITTYHERILYESDLFVNLYITGSANITLTIKQTIG